MSNAKIIRTKIRSVNSTKKIMKAMEMVATSKLKRAQQRVKMSRHYAQCIETVALDLASTLSDQHPFLRKVDDASVKHVGFIVISSDKGLCAGLNTQLFRSVLTRVREERCQGRQVSLMPVGAKALSYFKRISECTITSYIPHLGEAASIIPMLGPFYLMCNAFADLQMDRIYLCYNHFLNTMKRDLVHKMLLPIVPDSKSSSSCVDYLYEPHEKAVAHIVLKRYVESLFHQALLENISSEHSARMVAMKTAFDNASEIVNGLQLDYNKARQSAITKELAEIVGGASAV